MMTTTFKKLRAGLDIGSTTVKAVVIDEDDQIIYSTYTRHLSKIAEKTTEILKDIKQKFGNELRIAFSGSAGMGLAQQLGVLFIQEVYATKVALEVYNADVAIELGGEDAKILFLSGGLEVRMNGTCAGGTGSFIDQMATLLGVETIEINELSKNAKTHYPIASRCGVFAKTDIQPLLNQGADKADLAKSILYSIVNQTIGGLAQGRIIKGNVFYLGGPLTFLSELRNCFDEVLRLKGTCPPNSLYFVAIGAAKMADKCHDLNDLINEASNYGKLKNFSSLKPLFSSKEEYIEFKNRHNNQKTKYADISTYDKPAYLGVDSGSTTVKMVIIGSDGEILDSRYLANKRSPVEIVKEFLEEIYNKYPNLNLICGASTGYGEELIKNAFNFPTSIVETAAHFLAAKKIMPNVEFVIDIGGQDMKCFKIRNGAVDDIFLNEACSSGCGSFLQTFAETLGCTVEEFSDYAIESKSPVDLGSRCTVFMNSSIKQAQKDGASVADISAGLAVSVVKNALYKVIRVKDKNALGKNIVVQGGTFLSDAVLRAFEQELDVEVIRPDIAGLMGAYGAALYASQSGKKGILDKEQLKTFSYNVQNTHCGLCPNNCNLTINRFDGNRKFISGNRCERPLSGKKSSEELNIFDYKLKRLSKYIGQLKSHSKEKIGIPLQLNMYELLPFWYTFFDTLGFEVVVTPFSDHDTFSLGHNSIPSDTICYPAKLMHGHVQKLIDSGIKNIFYPCMSYNINENISNNHYNCPVVAYYPQVIGISVPNIDKINFIQCFIDLNKKRKLTNQLINVLSLYFPAITKKQVSRSLKTAYKEYHKYMNDILAKGKEIINKANEKGIDIIILSGRPYHLDPEVNHGIPQLICGMNKAVISDDCLPRSITYTSVLNQWTYHARMYSAAKYVCSHDNMHLVQLVSFGCGLDAITSDEMRRQLERCGKLYTQIKIDEIANLGAAKIRLRSMFAALEK